MMDDVTVLAGIQAPENSPWIPFDLRVVDFLADLSSLLLHHPNARQQEAISTLGFWCRRSHLSEMERRHHSAVSRLGKGLVFHIAPSNVPVQFAYSMAIGLLAGNANVVRLSSRRAEQDAALLSLLNEVLNQPKHAAIKARTCVISYDRNDEITASYCLQCDARVVWGSDATVATLRAMPIPPHAVELSFPNRWSLAVFSQAAFSALEQEDRSALARRFYNDTYPMDQNACSSPQLILWIEDGGTADCRHRWWESVSAEAKGRYSLGAFQATRKLEHLCKYTMSMTNPSVTSVEQYEGNLLYVANLERCPTDPTILQGGFGLFFQCTIANLEELPPYLSPKVQTLVCGGLEPAQIIHLLVKHRARGVDRVVALGQALEMDTIWDGKDMIAALSRAIS